MYGLYIIAVSIGIWSFILIGVLTLGMKFLVSLAIGVGGLIAFTVLYSMFIDYDHAQRMKRDLEHIKQLDNND